ncbi:hypothetical protein KSS87_012269 [Heliosperma pusillum]|nr:hypothetical protein KSS87_012269 [Heliosperma pusillum]
MIRSIRACKTAAEERAVVRKECAAIRAAISENDPGYRHRNMAKLMFIHMLAYFLVLSTVVLEFYAISAIPCFIMHYYYSLAFDRDLNHTNQYIVGLALCALGNICSAEMARDLAPEVERLLQFRDPNVRKKAALCSIRIIKKVPDLAENFINPAAALLKEKHHGVLITGVQLCTDLCKVSEDALEYFRKKCTDAVVRVLKDLVNSSYAPEYDVAGITDPFLHIRLLRFLRVLGHGDADASDCMNDILAQVATKTESNKNAGNAILYECVDTIMSIEDNSGLRVLAINILGRFLSNKDNNIRYVALNMLMRAINVDSQAVQRHRTTILECVKLPISVTSAFHYGYCAFQDSDASIRKRALDLVYLLVNETNVKPLTKELIEYLEASDHEFKGDLTTKICSIVEKFSPEKIWYIDQMMKVLCEAGNYVKDEVWHALIVVISNAVNLHGYTVRSLYRAVQASTEQETLVKVAVWCFGEYGDMLVNNVGMLDVEEPITSKTPLKQLTTTGIPQYSAPAMEDHCISPTPHQPQNHGSNQRRHGEEEHREREKCRVDEWVELPVKKMPGRVMEEWGRGLCRQEVTESDVIDIIEMAIKRHNSDIATSTMCLIALLKLSSRFPPCSQRVKEILVQHKGSLLLELQQRAIEFNSIIERHQNIRSTLMERMPVLDEATYTGRKSGSLPASISSSNGPLANLPNGIPKAAAAAAPLVDLLDLSSDDLPVPSSSGGHFLQDLLGDLSSSPLPSGSSQNQRSGTDALLDLLSIGSSPAANTSAIPDILSLSLETKHSGATLEGLSSVSSIPKQASSLSGTAPMMDLLDGLSSSQPTLVAESNGLQFPSIVAFESSSLKMTFDFAKDSANPQTTSIKATFVNLSVNLYTDFVFQAAVPKFLQLHLDPASNTTLPAAGKGSITQSLRVTNSQHGKIDSFCDRIMTEYSILGCMFLLTPLGSLSHHHRVSLSSTYYDSKVVQTDIVPNGGDYLMKIVVGTPPVEFTAVADTGSDLVWIQCSPCQRCIDQQSPLFDPTKSSTYHAIPCTSRACNQPGISASCRQYNNINDNSCTYMTQYGDGTKSKGVLNTETISFPSSEATPSSFPSFIFGCGYDQEGELGTDGNGIVGLGSGPLSLVSQLGPKINYKFSYCLTPEDSGVNSKLNFGLDITSSSGTVSTPFITQDADLTFYYLTLDGITVGSSLFHVATDVIIDSGTTLTYLPSSVYDNVRAALKNAISVSSVADPDQVFDPCYEAASLGEGFNPSNVVVHFRGADVVLKAENIFRTVDNLTCLAMVPTDDTPIFGNVAQVNFQVAYDLHAKKVSFATADCTKY